MQSPVHSQVHHQSSHRTKQSQSPFLLALIASSLPKRVKVANHRKWDSLINFSSISRKQNKTKNLSSSCTLKTLHFIYTSNSNTIMQSKNLDSTKGTHMRVMSNAYSPTRTLTWRDERQYFFSAYEMKQSYEIHPCQAPSGATHSRVHPHIHSHCSGSHKRRHNQHDSAEQGEEHPTW